MGELTAALERRGAVLGAVDGATTSLGFGDPAAEYGHLRERAGLVEWPWWSRLHVTGSDRVGFLQGMLSNDVKTLGTGQGGPALLLSEQGKTVADLVVLATDDAIVLAGNGTALANARAALERFIVADDVEIGTDDAAHAIAVLGPEAARVLERTGAPTPSQPYDHVRADIGGAPVQIVRVPTPGDGGFVLHVRDGDAATIWTSLVDIGGAAPAGATAFDVLRIESGVPWYGRDVTADTLALEAPYEAAISFRKGCYLGQEVMERVTARGHVNRKLVGLVLAGDVVPASQVHVFAGERDAGWVTSAAWSWRLGRVVALAYVRREHLAPGTLLVVGTAPGIAATVCGLPL